MRSGKTLRERFRLKPPGPALALFFLSPVLGELVSGYRAPLDFFSPLNLVITIVPYGCGALAVRELLVRRRKGWISLILLGAAFGLVFEGLVTRVIFNPDWEDLGVLAAYGRAYGVNWLLAACLVHFHAAVSISGSILLVEMLYPHRRGETWLGFPGLIGCCLGLLGWGLVLGLFVHYVPPLSRMAGLIALAAFLIALALNLPARKPAPRKRSAPRPLFFGLIGGIGMTLVMCGTYLLPEAPLRPPQGAAIAFLAAVVLAELWLLTRLNGAGAFWTDRHKLALVAGFLSFFLAFGLVQDFTAFTGRGLVALAAVFLLGRLWAVLRRREGAAAAGYDHDTNRDVPS